MNTTHSKVKLSPKGPKLTRGPCVQSYVIRIATGDDREIIVRSPT
jgi:hypothetical protein